MKTIVILINKEEKRKRIKEDLEEIIKVNQLDLRILEYYEGVKILKDVKTNMLNFDFLLYDNECIPLEKINSREFYSIYENFNFKKIQIFEITGTKFKGTHILEDRRFRGVLKYPYNYITLLNLIFFAMENDEKIPYVIILVLLGGGLYLQNKIEIRTNEIGKIKKELKVSKEDEISSKNKLNEEKRIIKEMEEKIKNLIKESKEQDKQLTNKISKIKKYAEKKEEIYKKEIKKLKEIVKKEKEYNSKNLIILNKYKEELGQIRSIKNKEIKRVINRKNRINEKYQVEIFRLKEIKKEWLKEIKKEQKKVIFEIKKGYEKQLNKKNKMLEEINKRSNSSLTKTQLILKEKKKYLIEIKESKDKLNVANERIKILETQIKELKNKDLINVQKIKELKKKLKKYKEENVANALKIQETEKKIKVMVNTQQKNQKTEEYFIKNDLIKKLKFFMESKVEVEVKIIDEEEPKALFKKFNLF